MSKRLAIPNPTGVYRVIEFPTPAFGLASPVNRTHPDFIGYGWTKGGAREFVVPNQLEPVGSIIRIVK